MLVIHACLERFRSPTSIYKFRQPRTINERSNSVAFHEMALEKSDNYHWVKITAEITDD